MRKKAVHAALVATVVAAVAAPVSAQAAPALSYTPVSSWWGANGRVMDIVPVGDKVFLAGGFDYVGPQTGYGTAVDRTGGQRLSNAPVVDGVVNASAPDGNGGWYIGGAFKHVGGVARTGAAHITASGQLDQRWNPKPKGAVSAITLAGNAVILGGSFTSIGKTPTPAYNIASVDRTQGSVTPGFSAYAGGPVQALATSGSAIYVGGAFTTMGGYVHQRLARIDATTGAVDNTFRGGVDNTVSGRPAAVVAALGVSPDGSTVYAGGNFTVASGPGTQNRWMLAAWSTATGELTPWSPMTDDNVEALAVDPGTGTVYAGGLFGTVGGVRRARLAAIDADGSLTSFDADLIGCQARHTTMDTHVNPPCTPEVSTLTAANGTLFVGGRFSRSGTTSRHDVAAFDLSSSVLTGWDPKASDRVLAVSPSGGNVFVGGEMTSVNGMLRAGVAALDLTTGAGVPSFTADTDNEVLDLTPSPDGGTLYLAGHFQTVNGVARSNLAAVSTADGSVRPFTANATDDVLSVAYAGGALFAAGQFKKINGVSRIHAAKLDPVTGAVDPTFVANATGPSGHLRGNGMVQSMVASPDGSRVFLAGPFDTVNGDSVPLGIVAVDGTSGALRARLGGVDGCGGLLWISHLYLSPDGQRLYGGDICPDSVYQWDAVNLSTAQNPTGLIWKLNCNGGMQGALEVNGTFYYGTHGTRGVGTQCWQSPRLPQPVSRSRFAAFDATTGDLRPDYPVFSSAMGVWSFAAVPQGLLVGGDFDWVGNSGTVRQGLVLFAGTP